MIEIHNLTKEQIEMLKTIWTIDKLEDFEHFCRSLPEDKRSMVATLTRLVEDEYLEIDIQRLTSYPIAEQWFTSIGIKLS